MPISHDWTSHCFVCFSLPAKLVILLYIMARRSLMRSTFVEIGFRLFTNDRTHNKTWRITCHRRDLFCTFLTDRKKKIWSGKSALFGRMVDSGSFLTSCIKTVIFTYLSSMQGRMEVQQLWFMETLNWILLQVISLSAKLYFSIKSLSSTIINIWVKLLPNILFKHYFYLRCGRFKLILYSPYMYLVMHKIWFFNLFVFQLKVWCNMYNYGNVCVFFK